MRALTRLLSQSPLLAAHFKINAKNNRFFKLPGLIIKRLTQITRMAQNSIRRKAVIVGDTACGKTSLILALIQGEVPYIHVPTVFENYVAELEIDQRLVELGLWDTAGHEDYDRLRPYSYPGSHTALICFSVDSPESLENVETKWISEIKTFCADVPVILVGCKVDLRKDQRIVSQLANFNQHPVTTEEGIEMAKKIQAKYYFETSATSRLCVNEIFEYTMRTAMRYVETRHAKKKRDSCIFM